MFSNGVVVNKKINGDSLEGGLVREVKTDVKLVCFLLKEPVMGSV